VKSIAIQLKNIIFMIHYLFHYKLFKIWRRLKYENGLINIKMILKDVYNAKIF